MSVAGRLSCLSPERPSRLSRAAVNILSNLLTKARIILYLINYLNIKKTD